MRWQNLPIISSYLTFSHYLFLWHWLLWGSAHYYKPSLLVKDSLILLDQSISISFAQSPISLSITPTLGRTMIHYSRVLYSSGSVVLDTHFMQNHPPPAPLLLLVWWWWASLMVGLERGDELLWNGFLSSAPNGIHFSRSSAIIR